MNPHRILIVEDEAIVALDIQQRLESFGYVVVGKAATGERAIALTEQQAPDLVLMDIRLQGAMDGITAANAIRQRFYRPVVFLTAHSEAITLERAKLAEPFGYIIKPFEDRELRTIIEIAIYKHRADDQLRRLNQLYGVLSRVNHAVVRVKSGPELIREVCRIVVESGDFQLAWFGTYNQQTRQIQRMTQAGEPANFTPAVISLACQRPAQRAIQEKQNFICNDLEAEEPIGEWLAAARAAGFRSAAGFCILRSGAPVGVMELYATLPGRFQPAEIELLQATISDIEFALDYLQKDKLRQLADATNRYRLKFEHHIAAISARFVACQDWDTAVGESLAEIGQFLGMDQVYVFRLNADAIAFENTHRWCGNAASTSPPKLPPLPTGEFSWSQQTLQTGQPIEIVDTDKLPAAAWSDRTSLRSLGSKSLFLLPLLVREKLTGFIGLSNAQTAKSWEPNDVILVRIMADVISRGITTR